MSLTKRWRAGAMALVPILAVLSTGLVGLLVWTQPALAALACPGCFGFEPLAPHLYVDREMSRGQRTELLDAAIAGEARLTAFYGRLTQAPTILACATQTCSRRVGSGGARGVAYATLGLRLSPSGLDPVIIAHERSHIELHGRIGLGRWLAGAVPAWFDEGLAVVVSNDPRYLRPEMPDGDRCRVEPGALFPAAQRDWLREASADPELYARAACRVARWMESHGGRPAVLSLLDRIAAGESFGQAFE